MDDRQPQFRTALFCPSADDLLSLVSTLAFLRVSAATIRTASLIFSKGIVGSKTGERILRLGVAME